MESGERYCNNKKEKGKRRTKKESTAKQRTQEKILKCRQTGRQRTDGSLDGWMDRQEDSIIETCVKTHRSKEEVKVIKCNNKIHTDIAD